MDAELRTKWLKALRSGDYEQGNGMLRDFHDRYCCIGVLAEVSGRQWKEAFGVYRVVGEPDPCGTSTLCGDTLTSLGIYGHAYALMGMNDDGKPFSEIADYIEANVSASSNDSGSVNHSSQE